MSVCYVELIVHESAIKFVVVGLFTMYILGASQTISYHHDKIQTANKHLIIYSDILLELSLCAFAKLLHDELFKKIRKHIANILHYVLHKFFIISLCVL